MGFREELQRRIEKKRGEVKNLSAKLKESEIYVKALEDTLKLLPRDEGPGAEAPPMTLVREGSTVARAKEALEAAGRPLHLSALLKAIGKPGTKDARAALAGSIGAYVRKGEIFTRPAPNTFGLTTMRPTSGSASSGTPPSNFGVDLENEEDPGLIDEFPGLPEKTF